MTNELKEFEKTIKKTHSVSFTPKYSEEIITNLSSKVFLPIVEKTIEKLGWILIYVEDNLVEAKRKTESRFKSLESFTESITITYDHGKILIKSESLGNEMWDNGRNSKRVKLFIHVLQETEKEFDRNSLLELEKEVEKRNNWDDYIIPESLPQPTVFRKPTISIPIVASVLLSVFLSVILAYITFKGKYIILLFESLIALSIGFVFKHMIRLSNYTNFKKLNYIQIGLIFLLYFLNQYFLYRLILSTSVDVEFGFLDFIKLRFKQGLKIDNLNTGWIGLVLSWIIQLFLTWIIAYVQLCKNVIKYEMNRVPEEVSDFAYYHFVKEKTEDQVRNELANYGWKNKEDQDYVFACIGANQGAVEFNRV